MKWTPERVAALLYGLAALAAAAVFLIFVFVANPPNVSGWDMLRAFLSGSRPIYFAWLTVLPLICGLFAVAYLMPVARMKPVALALWIAGLALAIATWSAALVPSACFVTLALVLVAAFTPVLVADARVPTCPQCAAAITRAQIAMATFPHWLSCRSCKAPLIGDGFVRREATAIGAMLVIWLVATLTTMYFAGLEMGAAPALLGLLIYLIAWPITVMLTCRYGTYVEREPTASRWWALDVGQWAGPRRP